MTLYPCLNDPGLIAARDAWFGKLQSLFDGTYREPRAFVLNGVLAHGKSDSYTHPEQWVDECLADIAENKANAIRNDKKFVPVCVEFGPYGVHYIDKILGAEGFFQDGQWYNRYLTTPIGELPEPDLDNDETFQLSIRAAKRFAEVGGAFPLYGLPPIATKMSAKTRATTVISLMRMLMEGPEVSLKGSPTVSPTTAALWASEPLPPWVPPSMYFLALSHAPPALDM